VHAIGKLLSRVIGLVTVLSGLAVALMMVHITADVIARYVFNYPLPGTISIVSNFYMVLVAFLPLAFAEQKSAHISVEVLTERFPAGVQRHLAGWLLLVSAVVFAFVTVRGWGEASAKQAINASIVQGDDTIAIWPSYYFIPIGCGLMSVVCAYKFLVYLTGARSGLDATRADPGATAAD
jgi:TRAP-type C4-dicarboxylate transport system permease small subunit